MIKPMQNLPDDTSSPVPQRSSSVPPAAANLTTLTQIQAGPNKEVEAPVPSETSQLEEVTGEMEISPEFEAAGIEVQRDNVDVPQDLVKMGVQPTGPAQQHPPVAKTVNLPLTDDQIITGLHAQIISSLRWLAEWCMRQLKAAHLHVRWVKGKIIREQE